MKRLLLLFLFPLFITFSFHAQDEDVTDWHDGSEKFRLESIARDILRADFNQLKSMAMSLGLQEQNNSANYRNALVKYYGIKLISRDKNKGETKIDIKRAGELKMFKLVEEEEENLHIIGKARLELSERDKDNKKVLRIIEADEIFINTKKKEITGIGDVYFKDDQLEYEGEQFFYDYDINRGVLFEGRTKLLKGGDSGLDGAYFTGEKIIQTGDDELVFYNGMLTTSEAYDPYYYMKVSRLWVSEKGEWGLLNGVVHVGPVPFFYFPFYYHPKELDLNPAFGFKSREGWYLNTTYFILGKKAVEESESKGSKTSSTLVSKRRKTPVEKEVFRITKAETDQRLNEFYNKREFYDKYPRFKIYPKYQSLDFALRVFGDAYTTLGFYTGFFFYFKAAFPNFPYSMHFLSDYAFSRTIWKEEESDVFISYNPDHKIKNPMNPKNTYFNLLANPLVFRTSQWFNMTGSLFKNVINLNYKLQFEYASDTNYFMDFYNRNLNFSYIDLLADTISYGLQSQSEEITNIETLEDENVTKDYNNIFTFISANVSPKKIPDVLGLKLLSKVNMDAESRAKLISTSVNKYLNIEDEAEDPKKERYLLYSLTAPDIKNAEIGGTLLDYKVFTKMPEEYKIFKNKVKNKDEIKKDNFKKELFIYIDDIKNTDASADNAQIDYKLLVPLFSHKMPVSEVKSKKDKSKFQEILFDQTDFFFIEIEEDSEDTDLDNENIEDKSEDEHESDICDDDVLNKYAKLTQVKKSENKKSITIEPVNFNLTYKLTDKMNNTLTFDTTTDDPKFDTLQSMFLDQFNPEDILKRLKIYNELNFSLLGSFSIIKIANNPLFKLSPKMYIKFVKNEDSEDVFRNFLDKEPDKEVDEEWEKILKENRRSTELTIKYNDKLLNDLSFGLYRIQGTQINTDLAVSIFKWNEQTAEEFILLDEANSKNIGYQFVSEPNWGVNNYYRRVSYERIETFKSSFKFNINLLPQGNDHSMSMGIGPLIKWVIPSAEIGVMKNELWAENQGDVSSDYKGTNLTNVAKDYIYYRHVSGNKQNLNSKIAEFFNNDFWTGPKYYRKMLSNITYTMKYSYKKFGTNIVSLSNNLVFVLDNIGTFSNLSGNVEGFAIYPEEKFNINFFNSMISYNLNIDFNKKDNTKGFDYSKLSSDNKKLDEYKIMTMIKTHTLNFKLPINLFSVKMPNQNANWLSFGTTLKFKWDRTITDWDKKTGFNYFFLDTQTVTLNMLMDIIKIKLNFKSFNFNNIGYGFELDSGSFSVGYNIIQIPIFWRYFKLTIKPLLTFDFVVFHTDYIESGVVRQFNNDYYEKNKLIFAIDFNLVIGEKMDFETKLHFGMSSENKRLYKYYQDDGVADFFWDLLNSFGIGKTDDTRTAIERRRTSPFNLKTINFWIEHNLIDWKLRFEYSGKPEKSIVSGRFNWENTFTFMVTWNMDTDNQLMKMFRKTNLDAKYEKGQFEQPILSLDPDED